MITSLYIKLTLPHFFSQSSQGGGHRTLLYGHAILLKHTHSSMVSEFTVQSGMLHLLPYHVLSSKQQQSHNTNLFLLLFILQYLSCLTTSRSLTDKLAFDVGLQEDSTGDYTTI